MAVRVVVIGGGIAGCAAAVAAARLGAQVQVLEAGHHLGGVAVRGEHRTLCGLAAIDAETPVLLEPLLVGDWPARLATGPAFRQGRVWLWPTDSQTLQRGLTEGLAAAGVGVRFGWSLRCVSCADGRIVSVDDGRGGIPCDALIDASGAAATAVLLDLPRAPAAQWPAHRSLLELPQLGTGRAERVRALGVAQRISGGRAACALTPIKDGRWQLSLDVPPGLTAAVVAPLAERVAEALGGTLIACAWQIAERDGGRPVATLGLAALFASRERGLCWAAWPQEAHGPEGVTWTWPEQPCHGVPEQVARPPGWPVNAWCVGRAVAVTAEAAAALRVTGTCLALGSAVGARAAVAG